MSRYTVHVFAKGHAELHIDANDVDDAADKALAVVTKNDFEMEDVEVDEVFYEVEEESNRIVSQDQLIAVVGQVTERLKSWDGDPKHW